MKRLFMTVGLPRSGKSTWAQKQGVPVVNPDSIRLSIHGKAFDPKWEGMVWFHARLMVESLFKAGHNAVILDATSVKESSRKQWSGDWLQYFIVFNTDIETCKDRAKATGQEYLLPVIVKMAGEWEAPIGDRVCPYDKFRILEQER